MKKLIITCTAIVGLSAMMTGCGWQHVNNAGDAVVNTGTGVVKTTGAVVDKTVGTGLDLLVGRHATSQDMKVYRKNGVVYHNGHAYKIQNGKYVLVR